MGHATAEDTTEEQTVTRRTERQVEVVTPARPPWFPFPLIGLIGVAIAVLAALIALLIAGAADDGPSAVDEAPEGALEGAIHWRAELAAASLPAALDPTRDTLPFGHDTRPDAEQPSDIVALNVAPYDSPAVVHDDLVIAANRLGEVLALERDSGRLVYRVLTDPAFDPDDTVETPGAGVVGLFGPSDGRVYAGPRDGRLLALDADTGRELWRIPTDLDFAEPVVVPARSTVVLGGDEATDAVALDMACTSSPRPNAAPAPA